MTTPTKFYCFVENEAEGVHDLSADTLYWMLTNSAPSQSNTIDGNLTEISAGNGYSAGGAQASQVSSAQSSGLYKLVIGDPVFTASGGNIGPFRYASLVNRSKGSAGNRPLIMFVDRGVSESILSGETLTIDADATNGIIQKT
jgi:hypothetical protein